MNYTISEEELNNLITKSYSAEEFEEKKLVKNFLKSKQEVELLAEGEVGINGYDISIFDDKNIQYIDDIETWEKYQGKHIKLYILEEVK